MPLQNPPIRFRSEGSNDVGALNILARNGDAQAREGAKVKDIKPLVKVTLEKALLDTIAT